ncbi:MAG: aldo/keto reductase [Lachnospiraceae bacterium]|nr:aldo/keto reductase [Lachnospiraceae bacterium]
MKTRFLREIEVSPIGMGCMAFSHGYGKVPEESYALEAIQKAYEFGCTLFDTAEGYGSQQFFPGHNEQILGKAVKSFRRHIVLATKMHFKEGEYTQGADIYKLLRTHLEKSLTNLQTDMLDLYYLHRINTKMPLDEVAAAFGRLIQEGLIRGWGMSQVSGEQLIAADQVTPVSAVQNLYNILERDCEQDIFPYCIEHGIGVVPFSPIASGFLSGKISVDTKFENVDDVRVFVPQLTKENIVRNQPVLDILNRFAKEKNATPAQISLAWMLHKYSNVVPIPGSKNQERILENLGGWNVELIEKEFKELEQSLANCRIYGHRGHVENENTSMKDWKR